MFRFYNILIIPLSLALHVSYPEHPRNGIIRLGDTFTFSCFTGASDRHTWVIYKLINSCLDNKDRTVIIDSSNIDTLSDSERYWFRHGERQRTFLDIYAIDETIAGEYACRSKNIGYPAYVELIVLPDGLLYYNTSFTDKNILTMSFEYIGCEDLLLSWSIDDNMTKITNVTIIGNEDIVTDITTDVIIMGDEDIVTDDHCSCIIKKKLIYNTVICILTYNKSLNHSHINLFINDVNNDDPYAGSSETYIKYNWTITNTSGIIGTNYQNPQRYNFTRNTIIKSSINPTLSSTSKNILYTNTSYCIDSSYILLVILVVIYNSHTRL
jgi:hypothetical protein